MFFCRSFAYLTAERYRIIVNLHVSRTTSSHNNLYISKILNWPTWWTYANSYCCLIWLSLKLRLNAHWVRRFHAFSTIKPSISIANYHWTCFNVSRFFYILNQELFLPNYVTNSQECIERSRPPQKKINQSIYLTKHTLLMQKRN